MMPFNIYFWDWPPIWVIYKSIHCYRITCTQISQNNLVGMANVAFMGFLKTQNMGMCVCVWKQESVGVQ